MNFTTVFYNVMRISLLMLMINVLGVVQASAQGNFVMVTDAEGEETSLRQKLVTKKRVRLRSTPSTNSEGPNVLPYNIFFHLKTDAGREVENGFFRVGDESGRFLGWIESDSLVKWGTRYVIEPRESDKAENRFKVALNGDTSSVVEFNPESVPDDASVNAFITGAPVGSDADDDNGPFPVAMLTARVAASAATAAELDAITKMKLEVVFVIENTGFMLAEYDGKTLLDRTVEMATRFVDSYQNASGNIPTRFGLVCYQDSVTGANMQRPKVVQTLTSNHSEWRNAISELKPITVGEDLPADGLSALVKANSSELGWSANSSKHVILLGHSALHDGVSGSESSFHRSITGKVERICETPNGGLWNKVAADARAGWVGSNTSGTSQSQLEQSYRSVGGSIGERLRKTKRLHTVRVGYKIRDKVAKQNNMSAAEADELIANVNEAYEELNRSAAPLSTDAIIGVIGGLPGPTLSAIITGANIRNMSTQDTFAGRQYKTLAGSDGFFAQMPPTPSEVIKTTEQLRMKVQSAVDLINKVASDSVGGEGERNEFTTPIYRLVNSAEAGEKIIGDPVQQGVASLRNANGRALGEKLVMVSKNELELLKSSFDSLYTTFRAKQKRSDRQDVGGILTDLQKLLASSAAGQKIDANTDLRDLITDLPLRTEALQITASDIAVMNTAAFESWLEDLQLAKEAAQTQLDTGDWLRVNDRSDLEYGFLRLSSLP